MGALVLAALEIIERSGGYADYRAWHWWGVGGVRHFHFYTLNRAELSYAICHLLGIRAKS